MIAQAFTFPAAFGLIGVEVFVIVGAVLAYVFRCKD